MAVYRFMMNGVFVDKNENEAKKFAVSVPSETEVFVMNKVKERGVGVTVIDKLKVSDIWDIPQGSYQDRISQNINKK